MTTFEPQTPHSHTVLAVAKTLARGGAETLLLAQARRLVHLGVGCHVVFDSRFDGPLRTDVEDAGAVVTGVPRLHLRPMLIRSLAGPACVVHTHSPALAAVTRLALGRRPHGSALIHTEHNVWPRYHPLTRVLNRLTFGRNDRAVAVSGVVRNSMTPVARDRTEVLHHGIDVRDVEHRGRSAVGRLRGLLGIAADVDIVGTVASLTVEKDYANLLAAAQHVLQVRSNTVVVCIGGGPLLEEMRERTEASGLSGRVHFLGERADAVELAADFDVFVLASRFEGLPVVLMEALALGLPIVATDAGGVPEIVLDGVTGRCVRRGRPQDLADAIVELLTDRNAAASLSSQARAHSRAFSIDRSGARLLEIYDEACPVVRSRRTRSAAPRDPLA